MNERVIFGAPAEQRSCPSHRYSSHLLIPTKHQPFTMPLLSYLQHRRAWYNNPNLHSYPANLTSPV